jgi:hypothetical protein
MLRIILKLLGLSLALWLDGIRSICADPDIFPGLVGIAQPQPITINETNICDPLYTSKGSCAFPNSTQDYWDSIRPSLQQSAANSYQLALQFVHALLFYSARNNGTSRDDYKNPKTGSFFFMTDSIFRPENSNAAVFFYEQSQAVQDIFFNHRRKLDSCFRAISLINIGAFCYLTSADAGFVGLYTNQTAAGGVVANASSVGEQLTACIPMVDVYCLVWYGISITTNSPFSSPFLLPNGAISQSDCLDLRSSYACNTSDCQSNINQFITSTIHQNGVTFAPSEDQITALNKIFTNQTAEADIAISPIDQSSLGYALIPAFWSGIPDYYNIGNALQLNDSTIYFDQWASVQGVSIFCIILGIFWE